MRENDQAPTVEENYKDRRFHSQKAVTHSEGRGHCNQGKDPCFQDTGGGEG